MSSKHDSFGVLLHRYACGYTRTWGVFWRLVGPRYRLAHDHYMPQSSCRESVHRERDDDIPENAPKDRKTTIGLLSGMAGQYI